MSLRSRLAVAVAACGLLAAPFAAAHVSVDGPAYAGKNQVMNFHIGHGCAGADTFRLEVQLPAEVTSVRPMPSVWGDAEIIKNQQDIPIAVVWTKATVKDLDDQYYEFGLRIRVPDAPFTTLYFPAIQTCRDSNDVETTVEWTALPTDTEGEPAASLNILPPRAPGWNKYQVPAAVDDLEGFFADAQIVWAGDSAYSANASTMELIQAEPDVSELASIAAGTEIWVKY